MAFVHVGRRGSGRATRLTRSTAREARPRRRGGDLVRSGAPDMSGISRQSEKPRGIPDSTLVMPWHATQRHTDRHDYRPTIDTTTVRHPSDPNHHTTTSGRGPDQDLLRRTPLPNNSVLVRLHLTSCSPFHISFSLFSFLYSVDP